MKLKISKSFVVSISLALLTCVFIFWASNKETLKRLELSSLDFSFRVRSATHFNPKIIIVEISEGDIARIGQWPWKRSWHAVLTSALTDMGAKAIYFDIIFSEPSALPEDDAVFADAIKRSKRVYLPFAFQPPSIKIEDAIRPVPAFSESLKGSGAINIYPDLDGVLRRIPLVFPSDKTTYYHSSLLIARDYLNMPKIEFDDSSARISNNDSAIRIPFSAGSNQMLIDWAGRWEKTFKHYSYLQILAAYKDMKDGRAPSVDLSDFKDSICLIGITATGLYDIKPIPLQPEYPGIGVMANSINDILSQKFTREINHGFNILALVILTLLPALLIHGERPLSEAMSVLAAGIAYFLINQALFRSGLRMHLFTPLFGLLSSYVITSTYSFVRISMERQRFFKMSVTDGLTGLYNIRYFKMLLETELALARTDANKRFSIVMSDVDHFKHFNDTYGHQVGDIVLKSVSTVLKNSVRNLDIVSRYGGEEMILLLRGSNLKDAYHVAEKIRKNIESCIVKDQSQNYKVTISIGVSTFADGDTVDSVIKRADDALYVAKKSGRNRVCTSEDKLPEGASAQP